MLAKEETAMFSKQLGTWWTKYEEYRTWLDPNDYNCQIPLLVFLLRRHAITNLPTIMITRKRSADVEKVTRAGTQTPRCTVNTDAVADAAHIAPGRTIPKYAITTT
jgi:hypothetical protein